MIEIKNEEDIKFIISQKWSRQQERGGEQIQFKCSSCGKIDLVQIRTLKGPFKWLCRKCKCLRNGEKGYWNNHDVWTDEIRQKRKQTCKNRYGVEYNCMRKDINESGRIASHSKEAKIKRRNTMIKRFGGPSPLFSSEIKSKAHWGYKYNNIHFDSSYELAYYIWLIDNNKQFIYHPNMSFEYIDENGIHHEYFPDFLIEGKFYEIKGGQFFNKEGEPYNYYIKQFWWEKYNKMKEQGVNILREFDIKPALEYCKKQYGKGYLKSFKIEKAE